MKNSIISKQLITFYLIYFVYLIYNQVDTVKQIMR